MLKNKYTRLKAFTLSEMIVVLMITLIVVGLAFAVLNLVQKQMGGIANNYEKRTEMNLLRQALWIDFNSYSSFLYDGRTNSLLCENEIGSIKYAFEDEFILREKDTFHIKLNDKLFFNGGLEKASGQIDALELSSQEEGNTKSIFIYHKNAAEKYMY